MKTILSIQSQVAGARVGNSVAAFAMERLGVQVWQLPTTILGRRPDHGAPGGGPIPAETLASLFSGLAADGALGDIDAVLTGYLGGGEQVAVVLDAVERVKTANPKAVFVCDPVLGDDGKLFVRDELADAMVNGLVPHADWLTPNAFELGLLAGKTIDSLSAARDAARRIGKPTLCTSIRTALGMGNLYAAPSGDWFCETARLPRAPKGTGDLLTALFVARRVRGEAPAVALEAATGAVYDVIVRSLAAESEDLLLPGAQDVLAEPVTWPRARSLEIA
ncbi:MAG TPA: pyridoxal kinase [Vitreimonas sp.]|nr:pyridoxal kinase [Vitreimonas sp.]